MRHANTWRAFSGYNNQTPDTLSTVRWDLEQVLDLPYVKLEQRSKAVDSAAKTLAVCLRDSGGCDCSTAGSCGSSCGSRTRSRAINCIGVYEQAQRSKADARTGFAKKAGALFVSRLNATPWWDGMLRQPQVRVASG